MLSRERKAELVAELDNIAVEDRSESTGALARILAELIEAMPEEGCGESEAEALMRGAAFSATEHKYDIVPPVAASPTGVGEESTAA